MAARYDCIKNAHNHQLRRLKGAVNMANHYRRQATAAGNGFRRAAIVMRAVFATGISIFVTRANGRTVMEARV
jgi:hypothetical protein